MKRGPLRGDRLIPALEWGHHYRRQDFSADLVAGVIVTITLIPQSMAYALLAGLPPQVGLYAAILPLVAYALFGSRRSRAKHRMLSWFRRIQAVNELK